jgi:hypothetical protein
MRKISVYILFMLGVTSFYVCAESGFTTPINEIVDTGSHTCSSNGQEKKVYKDIYAGDSRYFVDPVLAEVSKFGAGDCQYNSDGGAPAVQMGKFKLTDADGQVEITDKPVRYIVRAFADCTNNNRIGSRIGTECRFTATSKRGAPAP